jgi:hypothetical protein
MPEGHKTVQFSILATGYIMSVFTGFGNRWVWEMKWRCGCVSKIETGLSSEGAWFWIFALTVAHRWVKKLWKGTVLFAGTWKEIFIEFACGILYKRISLCVCVGHWKILCCGTCILVRKLSVLHKPVPSIHLTALDLKGQVIFHFGWLLQAVTCMSYAGSKVK